MVKALITKEQEKGIKYLKSVGYNSNDTLRIHCNGGFTDKYNKKTVCLNSLSIEELVLAWNEYYEIKKTPEELVIDEYKNNLSYLNEYEGIVIFNGINRAIGFKEGIEFVNEKLKLGLKLL